jgi:uncharacterized protein (UPF0332 family)
MSAYWDKARQAARSARLLLEADDPNGAANRAYYAMFNTARAALAARSAIEVADVRRHTALRQLFSLHIVRPGLVPGEASRALNEVFSIRAVADYDRDAVSSEDARQLIEATTSMLEAVDRLLAENGN